VTELRFFSPNTRTPLGFVCYGPSRDNDAPEACAEIYGLYVHPDAWSTGKGQQLHDPSRCLYSRRGWQPEGATRSSRWTG